MKAFPVLLAAVLAAGGATPAGAAHDHDTAQPTARGAPPAAGEPAACAMMKAANANARGKHPPMAGHQPMHGPLLEPALPPPQAAALGLDAAQRQQLAALEKQHRARQWVLLGELREEQLALAEQLAAAATARLRAVQDLEARLLETRLSARRDALALLTPQQRSQLLAAPRARGAAGGNATPAAPNGHDDHDDDDDEEAPGGAAKQDPHAGHH